MTGPVDHYQVLGLSSQAEDVVIVAAYRALASRYHPDKFSGSDAEPVHRRMAQINAAYAVLGDPALRQVFDAERGEAQTQMAQAQADAQAREQVQARHQAQQLEQEEAQREAQARVRRQREQSETMEVEWQTAVKLYPDLPRLRERLECADAGLALSFVRGMLTSGEFDSRRALAETLEKRFFQKTFGTNAQVLAFARELSELKLPAALAAFKDYLNVAGPNVDAALLVKRVEREFDLATVRGESQVDQEAVLREQVKARRIARLQRDVTKFRNEVEARDLAQAMGYEVSNIDTGSFRPRAIEVANRETGEVVARLADVTRFVDWVVARLCKP